MIGTPLSSFFLASLANNGVGGVRMANAGEVSVALGLGIGFGRQTITIVYECMYYQQQQQHTSQ